MVIEGLTTVLCVGNDLVNLNLRCSALQKCKWNVVSAGSGHDGLLRFAGQKAGPDVVVLDLNHDGAENALIASEFKRLCPGVRIVMIVNKRETLVPGVTDLADAIVLKSEEETALADYIRGLLRES